MTDLDGELEKMRAEARHKLDGERELEEKLASYEASMPKAAPPAEETEEERPVEKPVTADVAARTAEEAAKSAASRVSKLSTPALVASAIGILFGIWILERIAFPLAALVVLVIALILGYRFLRWLFSERPGEAEPDDDED